MSTKNTDKSKKSPSQRFQKDPPAAERKNKNLQARLPVLVCAAIIAIIAAFAVFAFTNRQQHAQKAGAVPEHAHSVSLFDDGEARHFSYATEEGITIRYFVLKSTDGIIRAAFDACDVCWPENKGYYQQGHYMVCENCGRKFASVKVNEIKGGCNPAPLKRRVIGDQLVIRTADILEGKKYFDFSAGGYRG